MLSKQCTPLANGIKLPENQVYLTNSRINWVLFFGNSVIKIIRNLKVNNVHGDDDTSVRMIKMCDYSLVRPFSIIFPNSLNSWIYLSTRKKANVMPIHKKKWQGMCEHLPPSVASASIGESFWKTNFQWNLFFSW